MQKIYLSLFLTITTLSTLCMEQPLHRYPSINNDSTEIPLAIFTQPQPVSKQTYEPIIDTNWPFYNNIMDISYQRAQQPTTIANTNTTSLYPKIVATIKEVEIKLLLPQPDPFIMQNLYDHAYNVINHELYCDTNKENRKFIPLINAMNEARKKNIHEDFMGEWAYKKYNNDSKDKYLLRLLASNYQAYDNYEKKCDHIDKCISLTFNCLKKYRLTIEHKPEAIPSDVTTTNKNLAQALNITLKEVLTAEQDPITEEKYPAYIQLQSNIRMLINTQFKKMIYPLASCVYSDPAILFEDYSQGIYDDLKYEFCTKAYYALYSTYNLGKLDSYYFDVNNYKDIFDLVGNFYNVLTIIERAQILKDIRTIKDFGRSIFTYNPTATITGKIHSWLNSYDFSADKKNKIVLFLNLIEKYINARSDKITPTPSQWCSWYVQLETELALPESFNNTVFDNNRYAFNEFRLLIDDIIELKKSDDRSVEVYVNELYFKKGAQ